jgi:hypothetical protein
MAQDTAVSNVTGYITGPPGFDSRQAQGFYLRHYTHPSSYHTCIKGCVFAGKVAET